MSEKEDAARQYLEARKAVRDATDPKAFLRLGLLYTRGIGIGKNYVLANYFFEKALAMGCEEAEVYISQAYELGLKDIVTDVNNALNNPNPPTPDVIAKLRKQVEKERIKKNYGRLSQLREHLSFFYPNYNQDKAIVDFLKYQDTTDADILYSTCTTDNKSEVDMEMQDHFLNQLYAPIIQNEPLVGRIKRAGNIQVLGSIERELYECIYHLISKAVSLHQKYGFNNNFTIAINTVDFLPFIKPSFMSSLRKLGFRCLLFAREIDPVIQDEFMKNLDNDGRLLDISATVKDEDLQMFLMSFVELNVDIDELGRYYLSLIKAYKEDNRVPLANSLNDFIERLTNADIDHHLSAFSPEDLPPIDLPSI